MKTLTTSDVLGHFASNPQYFIYKLSTLASSMDHAEYTAMIQRSNRGYERRQEQKAQQAPTRQDEPVRQLRVVQQTPSPFVALLEWLGKSILNSYQGLTR